MRISSSLSSLIFSQDVLLVAGLLLHYFMGFIEFEHLDSDLSEEAVKGMCFICVDLNAYSFTALKKTSKNAGKVFG